MTRFSTLQSMLSSYQVAVIDVEAEVLHDRGAMLRDVAVSIADGAQNSPKTGINQ